MTQDQQDDDDDEEVDNSPAKRSNQDNLKKLPGGFDDVDLEHEDESVGQKLNQASGAQDVAEDEEQVEQFDEEEAQQK